MRFAKRTSKKGTECVVFEHKSGDVIFVAKSLKSKSKDELLNMDLKVSTIDDTMVAHVGAEWDWS